MKTDLEGGILLKGLKELSSNILAQTKQMTGSTPKAEDSSTKNSMPAETQSAVSKVTKLTKPAKSLLGPRIFPWRHTQSRLQCGQE